MRPFGPSLLVLPCCLGLAVLGCAGGGDGGIDATPVPSCADEPYFEPVEMTCDGLDNDCNGAIDDVDDAPLWFIDADGDGHGFAPTQMKACGQPDGYVASNDDCDDTTALRHVGLPETCDGLDNDCVVSTRDDCPAGCMPRTRPDDDRHYMFCSTAATFEAARAVCAADDYRLARIDDAAENTWLRAAANGTLGTGTFFHGGNDIVTDNTWLWEDGSPFWQGVANGAAVAGSYTAWAGGEPNNANSNEDCGEVRPDALWNDISCAATRAFACERD